MRYANDNAVVKAIYDFTHGSLLSLIHISSAKCSSVPTPPRAVPIPVIASGGVGTLEHFDGDWHRAGHGAGERQVKAGLGAVAIRCV